MSLPPRPTGSPGAAMVIKLKEPNYKQIEETAIFNDSYFPLTGSVLLFDARIIIEGILNEHKKELRKYNASLTRNGIPLRIKLTHSTISKNKKYIYCGRYLYQKDGRYLGKLDNAVLRSDFIREKWNQVGPPPRNPLEGFKYIAVMNGKTETKHVIIPYVLYTNPNFSHLFKKLTSFKLA